MRRPFWQVRIPTIFGLLILIGGVFATSFLVKSGVIVIGQASPSEIPQGVRITDVSDTSFAISYKTDAKVVGTISFGTDKNLGTVTIDDRDQTTGTVNLYNLHHTTIKKLTPQTTYFFQIQSGGKTYLHDNAPFEISTAPTISSQPLNQSPIAGKVIQTDGSIPPEAIVYLKTPTTEPLSVLVKNDGSYLLPMQAIRSENLASYAPVTDKTVVSLLVLSAKESSNVSLFASAANPAPLITLSQSYNFTSALPLESPPASESALLHFPTVSTTEATAKQPAIQTPKNNQEVLDQQPQFRGNAAPGSNVQIIIHSDQAIKTQVKADANGNWSYRPTEQLSPGKHTISIIAPDPFGVLKTITQSFTVYAAGNQVSQSATPSATPTIALPTQNPTPTPTLIPTTAIQQISTPTPYPTAPLLILSPTAPAKASAPLPNAGNETYLILTGGAIGLLLFGILLFITTRHKTFV